VKRIAILRAALALAAGAQAAPLCLVARGARSEVAVPAREGEELRVSFRHSIYGARVEEIFRVSPGGFAAERVRYAEPRLVEFYGHERAREESGWWVVAPRAVTLPEIALRWSGEAAVEVILGAKRLAPPPGFSRGGEAMTLSVRGCAEGIRER
jgi:hypothetical protein